MFVLGVTVNVIRDVQRRNARHRALILKLAGRTLLETDDLDRIEAAIDAAGTADRLGDALDAMPAGEQEMLRLVAAGQTPEQAANQLGISYPAGRARLSRARRRVRRHLTPLRQEEP
jgi:RNA polymerase sigma-70 factor (ECF subfamily)